MSRYPFFQYEARQEVTVRSYSLTDLLMSRFKTKARAVDLLGEKQIKDDTTAISELFKNAHDADASHAELCVDTGSNTIVLWDDGVGMSPDDVENKWLTLGTDSKLSMSGSAKRSEKFGRVMMGEKGIGRLAIATLGKQMLMITKKEGHPYVVAYIHWGVFGNGNLLLEDTVVPIKYLDSLDELATILPEIRERQRGNLVHDGAMKEPWRGNYATLGGRILDDITSFHAHLSVLRPYLLDLANRASGTIFYVTNLKEKWADLIHPAQKSPRFERKRNNLAVMLSSFINTVRLFEEKAHDTYLDDVYSFIPKLLIDGKPLVSPEVFTAEDLSRYDYGLVGSIRDGVFVGQSLIYGQPPKDIRQVVTDGLENAALIDCGPCELRIYFVEGLAHNSRLPREVHATMTDKLEKIGGIYLYRDDLRVLPYGAPEFDFLEIEKRRTLKAGTYLFSLRRMFGYIAISKENNPELQDKSSREGLRENDQYEYFRSVLMNLMVWWGVEYLNRAGRRKEYIKESERRYRTKQAADELEARRKREQDAYLRDIKIHIPAAIRQLQTLKKALEAEINNSIPLPGRVSAQLLVRERGNFTTYFDLLTLSQRLAEVKSHLALRIDGLVDGVRPSLNERYAHLADIRELEHSLEYQVAKTKQELHELLDARYSTALEYIDGELRRFLTTVAQKVRTFSGEAFVRGLADQIDHVRQSVERAHDEVASTVQGAVESRAIHYLSQLQMLQTSVNGKKDHVLATAMGKVGQTFGALRQNAEQLEDRLQRFVTLEQSNDLSELAGQIQDGVREVAERLSMAKSEADEYTQIALGEMRIPILDVVDNATKIDEDRKLLIALESKLDEMNNQMEQYRGLVATGIAAEVVNHEFEQQYELIHRLLGKPEVQSLIARNADLGHIQDLFKHVEERHRLLSPLYRRTRMYRKSLSIRDIGERMREFFHSHIQFYRIDFRNDVEEEFTIYESEPILYPVLINIINNAVYWLLNQQERTILLHSDHRRGLLFIEDSGPGISQERSERVFELFYSTRADGRGIGLHLAAELLGSRNHTVSCITEGSNKFLKGACFKIQFDPQSNVTGRAQQ